MKCSDQVRTCRKDCPRQADDSVDVVELKGVGLVKDSDSFRISADLISSLRDAEPTKKKKRKNNKIPTSYDRFEVVGLDLKTEDSHLYRVDSQDKCHGIQETLLKNDPSTNAHRVPTEILLLLQGIELPLASLIPVVNADLCTRYSRTRCFGGPRGGVDQKGLIAPEHTGAVS